MGIKGLIGFLSETAPGSLSECSLESLSGTTVAIDASTALYQFTIAIREGSYLSSLTNSKGESTSHITGLLNRCIRLFEFGLKPIFVFDSTPPEAKLQTLAKRKELRQEAENSLEEAKERDDKEAIRKYVGRTVHISKKENDSAKQLLRLMGVPVIEAEEEAEAQCAYLVKQGLADAVGTEDADALVFGCGVLLKNLTASNKKILKVDLPKVLKLLNLSHEEFTDFCILCGCDYCGTLKGIGPKTAYNLIKKHKTLARILEVKSETLEGYEVAQEYFKNPKVRHIDEIPRVEVDVQGLKDFLIVENDFAEDRVNKIIDRFVKAKSKKTQLSLKSFFGGASVVAKSGSSGNTNGDKVQKPSGSTVVKNAETQSVDHKDKADNVVDHQKDSDIQDSSNKYEGDDHGSATKQDDKPTIGLAAFCPSDIRLVKKRNIGS
ncbi:flap endonuclease 1 [Babesia ovis]|uniref:Flap endonuclease 1 n=1 Tax=Babesia ovis TaxID=5869 RepID=A0A9W5WTD6_BABOV|nr:flap endonuclease 1 [Babesia ovis]